MPFNNRPLLCLQNTTLTPVESQNAPLSPLQHLDCACAVARVQTAEAVRSVRFSAEAAPNLARASTVLRHLLCVVKYNARSRVRQRMDEVALAQTQF